MSDEKTRPAIAGVDGPSSLTHHGAPPPGTVIGSIPVGDLEQALAHDEARKQSAPAAGQRCDKCGRGAVYLGGRSWVCPHRDCSGGVPFAAAPPPMPAPGEPVPKPVDRKRERMTQLRDLINLSSGAPLPTQRSVWPAICEYANLRLEDALARELEAIAKDLGVETSWIAGLPVQLAAPIQPPIDVGPIPPRGRAGDVRWPPQTESAFANPTATVEDFRQYKDKRRPLDPLDLPTPTPPGSNEKRERMWVALEIAQGSRLDKIGGRMGRDRLDSAHGHPEPDGVYRDALRLIAGALSETDALRLRLDVVEYLLLVDRASSPNTYGADLEPAPR